MELGVKLPRGDVFRNSCGEGDMRGALRRLREGVFGVGDRNEGEGDGGGKSDALWLLRARLGVEQRVMEEILFAMVMKESYLDRSKQSNE